MTMHPARLFCAALAVILLTAASSLNAQQPTMRTLANEPGTWRPWTCIGLSQNDIKSYSLTQSDVDAFKARLQQIAEVFRSSPVWSPPMGVDPSLTGSLFMPSIPGAKRTSLPIAGTIMMGCFDHYEVVRPVGNREQHERYVGGETSHIMIDVNMIPSGDGVNMLSDNEGKFYEEPVRTADMGGFPTYGDDLLIMVKNGRPVWTPITRERYLKAFIAKRRPEAANAERYIADQQKKYEAFVAPDASAARQAKYKAAVDKMASKGAAAAEHERRYWERDEADQLALLKRGASHDPKDSAYAGVIAGLKAAEEQLASMSLADRSAPACLLEDMRDPTKSGLVAMGTPQCKPLVGKNPNFFDPDLPRSVPQIIVVQRFKSLEKIWKEGRPDQKKGSLDLWTTYEVFRQTDWQKVADHIGR
jgi:hypothetical protein